MKRSTRFTLSSAVALAVAGVIPSTVAWRRGKQRDLKKSLNPSKTGQSLQEIPVAVSGIWCGRHTDDRHARS
ncbi:MAG: hypothetical protein CM15mP74_36910 [Halieaceae bacterium]|nr:MAG: hypothetical protein CM15mP74_36910 [Halieaceae bacterium]